MPAPSDFTWPGGHRLALSIVVNVEEGAEQNIRDGDKGPEPVDELSAVPKRPMRMHGNESNYQYGIKAGAPRILKLLDEHRIEATWTAAALALERAPELAAKIVARGDEVCCHGWRWAHQFWMDEDKERDFIRKGWQSIERTTGKRPTGWLSRYLHTEATRRLLVEEGFAYHMDDYSDDFPFWDVVETADGAKPIVILPYALDSNDMKFWLAPALTARDWLQYATDTFDQMHAEALEGDTKMMSLGLHLRIIGRPGRIDAFRGFLEHIAGKPGVWVTHRAKIAEAFAAAVPSPAA
ncbi:polysaccharide deacetylase family protein [Phenylobacterium sp.]|jgi:peptidoglycan/xylan/chitin deacetylase (PgdA/CDA1 family)|uniref:polysaccharide deacetylase family protein n=1 Tax=Phenylobacterium sp. TaxID=1871053 RepID=UPI0025E09254|nr:polysaccharide deacetylase family protein [Phenylobacterium sp.]MCA3585776.1 polysaccharide deacetylase family protein [Methylocystis sp.]MCA6286630.1 polysaccharide deacetylase family protein [Phenylobacterium sp.]MCA6288580.1 polysaccharide deacetylase family protein [Phenylobacterium sp.]MCA6343083.1 polysaccharide deacetylase family protein [Phenylobacterium sp.]MCA6346220.1 polysaccharide deacetylase family protein [Phenylobacterium sp.]